MADARTLLARALALYDTRPALASAARASVATGFEGGLSFMCMHTRSEHARGLGHLLGVSKYTACVLVALLSACVIARTWGFSLAALVFVLAFYALESRWVFVFPAAAHGEAHPFRASWRLTRRAGGTLAAMRVVLPIAGHMLFGPLVGRGLVRAWASGCLAVLLWYEELRGAS